MSLVEITPSGHGVEIDLAYAGADNFTGRPVYRRAACYLHADAERLLGRAVALAAAQGFRLKIFDAFRPTEAQWVLWNHTPDPEFLADPRRGSPHSRGVAVDLTLIDGDGRELEMGTSGLYQLKCTHTIAVPVSSAGGEAQAMRGHRQAVPTPRGDRKSDPQGGVARPPDVVARRL